MLNVYTMSVLNKSTSVQYLIEVHVLMEVLVQDQMTIFRAFFYKFVLHQISETAYFYVHITFCIFISLVIV